MLTRIQQQQRQQSCRAGPASFRPNTPYGAKPDGVFFFDKLVVDGLRKGRRIGVRNSFKIDPLFSICLFLLLLCAPALLAWAPASLTCLPCRQQGTREKQGVLQLWG